MLTLNHQFPSSSIGKEFNFYISHHTNTSTEVPWSFAVNESFMSQHHGLKVNNINYGLKRLREKVGPILLLAIFTCP